MSQIDLNNVTKYYGDLCAVRDVTLSVAQGEFFSLLGPSGSGKTTILRMIAGFLDVSSGSILIGGKDLGRVPPERRGVGIVFQNYALFPHLNVYENVAFGLKARKLPRSTIDERVSSVLDRTGLAGYERRFPRQLSGGEQQRVAVARALVIEPQVLLLDEPLGALDRLLREQMQYWLKRIQNETGVTTVYVTHDQTEALTMSDRVAVMNRGAVEQIGKPRALYEDPGTRFVASFMGDNNVLAGHVVEAGQDLAIVETTTGLRIHARSIGAAMGSEVVAAVRPEDIRIQAAAEGSRETNAFQGTVLQRIYRGTVNRYDVELTSGRTRVSVDTPGRMQAFEAGDPVTVLWEPQSVSLVA